MNQTAESKGLLKNEDRIALYYSSEYERYRCARVKAVIEKQFQSNTTVLEIGPGPGIFTEDLLKMGCRVIAAEPASDRARALAERCGKNTALEIIEEYFPISSNKKPKDRSVQGVIALEVIEHVAHPDKFLEECARVITPGGKLLLSTPNRFSLEAIVHLLKYVLLGQVYYAGDPTHIWLFRPGKISSLIRQAGFKITYFESMHFGCGDKGGGKIPGLPFYFSRLIFSRRWPLNRLGFNLIIVAERL